jgi:MarR family 2-MHQ and catechol resistance regulon transcriptional repressor
LIETFNMRTASSEQIAPLPSTKLVKEPAMAVVRAMAEAYFAFRRASERHIHRLGLTTAQFDVIATLGNTDGMTCKELARRTLVTKGTLTGVLDRLESRRLISRQAQKRDRRTIKVRLTARGEVLFRTAFTAHMNYLRPYLRRAASSVDSMQLSGALERFAQAFNESPKGLIRDGQNTRRQTR